jgi:hypothetical protein
VSNEEEKQRRKLEKGVEEVKLKRSKRKYK